MDLQRARLNMDTDGLEFSPNLRCDKFQGTTVMDTQEPRKQGALRNGHMGNLAPTKPSSKSQTMLHIELAHVAGKREAGRIFSNAPTYSFSSTETKRKMEAT